MVSWVRVGSPRRRTAARRFTAAVTGVVVSLTVGVSAALAADAPDDYAANPAVYNYRDYIALNGDLASYNPDQAGQHFQEYGRTESRASSLVFSPGEYRARNGDLAGLSDEQLHAHFNRYGIGEGRGVSPIFDFAVYRDRNPDLAATGINTNYDLLQHFLQYGVFEGRTASNDFDVREYGRCNPDVLFTDATAYAVTAHYLKYGRGEGRNPHGGCGSDQQGRIETGNIRPLGALPVLAENTRPTDGTNCEPAFVVQDYAGVQGSLGMISAGHCDTPGKSTFSVSEDHDFEIVPLNINSLNAPTVLGGKELVTANYFRVNWHNGDTFTAEDRSNISAHPTQIGANGSRVCRYGGKSATQCGNIVRDDYAPSYITNANSFYILDIPCEKGDSGAAVVSEDGTHAVGIISGRRKTDYACIVSRLDRVFPGMKLYQPPAPDAKFKAIALLDGQWYPIGGTYLARVTDLVSLAVCA